MPEVNNPAASQSTVSDARYLIDKQRSQRQTGPGTLDKDAFMKILVAQLGNQDPTNPMKDNEFIAQMAQFSSLEQTMNLARAFDRFADAQNQSQLIQYNSFMGQEIRWHEVTDKKDEEGNPVINEGTGVIQSLKYVNGSVVFTLADGKELTPGNISEVLNSTGGGNSSNSLVQASMLIGKTVSYSDGDEERTGKVVSVTNKEGKLQYVMEDGTKVEGKQFTAISE